MVLKICIFIGTPAKEYFHVFGVSFFTLTVSIRSEREENIAAVAFEQYNETQSLTNCGIGTFYDARGGMVWWLEQSLVKQEDRGSIPAVDHMVFYFLIDQSTPLCLLLFCLFRSGRRFFYSIDGI